MAAGNPFLAAIVALANIDGFGESRCHPLDSWMPEGEVDRKGRVIGGAGRESRRTHPVLNKIRSLLTLCSRGRSADIRVRVLSRELLSKLGGDGRFEICGAALVARDEFWVGIPSCDDLLASRDLNLDFSGSDALGCGYEDADEISVVAFEVGGIPISKAQYYCFFLADDYLDERWWPNEGGVWLNLWLDRFGVPPGPDFRYIDRLGENAPCNFF